MKKLMTFMLTLLMCIGMIMVFSPQTVHAAKQEGDIAGGVYDKVDWRITSDGELIIGDGTEQTFTYRSSRRNTNYPWDNDRAKIKSVRFDGIVHGNGAMSAMFWNCTNLSNINLDGFETDQVTSMASMFSGCSKLTSLDVSNLDTSKVTDMSYMFNVCRALKSLDLSSFDTSNVTNMDRMFMSMNDLCDLNLGSWNTQKVTSMSDLYFGVDRLERIVLGENYTLKKLPSASSRNQHTGKWVKDDYSDGPYTSNVLAEKYNAEMAGVWVAELPELPYAVFDETTGVLSFVRERKSHDNNSTGTVRSISGGEYTGTIFDVSEAYNSRTWSSIASQVKKVQFVDEIKPKSVDSWFSGFTNCTSMDLDKLDTSNTTNMYRTFYRCESITSLNLSHFDTSKVYSMWDLFNNCKKLEYLNLSGWDTSKVNGNAGNTFHGVYSLKKIVLGEKFSFQDLVNNYFSMPSIPATSDGISYTQKWIRDDKAFGPYTSAEFRDNYTSEMAGTWIWEPSPTEYTIVFKAEDGAVGSMTNVTVAAKSDFTIPTNQFRKFGYDFDHWVDSHGYSYDDNGVIPANRFRADETATLTAVFKKRDTSVTMKDGAFTFDIKAGEKATFNDIPAGTSYQVYELTPDGWVLVQQENASGVIEALEESAAAFWNKYQPGVTTVQFSGLKTLDGHPAKEGTYSFELLENSKVIDTATTQDGGFIQFNVIEYDAAGDHTYTIREVEPDDDSVDYDMHEETVTVSVTDDGKGNLSSEVTYDEDGIKFENHTRPGILRITKNANVTEANKDDTFTFEITFSNENGMPISDNIYWYVENGAEGSAD